MSAADEWQIVNRYLHPPLPEGLPASAYWHVKRFGKIQSSTMSWKIVDRDGVPISEELFGSSSDADRRLEELRK